MEKTVQQVANLAGISVRTLHYYDEIGLLKAGRAKQSGYRIYDDRALERLQQILFFRELDFPLKEIQRILDSPSFQKKAALERHRELLLLKCSRLNSLIGLVDAVLKGENTMSVQEFNRSEIDELQRKYVKEAKETWGETQAYQESEKKITSYKKEDWSRLQKEMEGLYQNFAVCMEKGPESEEAQDAVRSWQDYITRNYYQCTDEILAGLAQLYRGDKRFMENIDQHGEGLAEFISRAIECYCGKKEI